MIVVDTSVAIAALTGRRSARDALVDQRLVAPAHIDAEVAHVLRGLVLGRKLGELLMHLGVLLSISGCVTTPAAGRPLLGPGLKPSPLPVTISRIDSSPSKATLSAASAWSKKASQWSDDSKTLLSNETLKSPPSSDK